MPGSSHLGFGIIIFSSVFDSLWTAKKWMKMVNAAGFLPSSFLRFAARLAQRTIGRSVREPYLSVLDKSIRIDKLF